MIPEKVVLVASPVVRVAVPNVTFPIPLTEPMVAALVFAMGSATAAATSSRSDRMSECPTRIE
jgi:hypothetical protein